MTRLGLALPVWVVAATFVLVSPSAPLAVALALLVFVSGAAGGRLALPRWLEWAAVVAAGGVGAMAADAMVLTDPSKISSTAAMFTAAALSAAATRLAILRPWAGTRVTTVVALFALVGCGAAKGGMIYPVAVLAFVTTAIWALRTSDPHAPPATFVWRHRAWATGLALGVAATIGVTVSLALPTARDASVNWLMPDEISEGGLSNELRLGSLGGMLVSDTMVMRLRGAAPGPLLRGPVYTRYKTGRWLGPSDTHRHALVSRPRAGANVVEVEILDDALTHVCVPPQARRVVSSSTDVLVDGEGVLTLWGAEMPVTVEVAPGGPALAGASPEDLSIPEPVNAALRPVALRWTAAATDIQAKLEALDRGLKANHDYSLDFRPSAGVDPVVDFVLSDRPAHCEYFAAAMVLLARSLGIAARVVGGYRVTEFNAVGGYHVVRKQDAHSWVEAWVPGRGWVSFDPTASTEGFGDSRGQTPLIDAVMDAAVVWLSEAWRWLRNRTTGEIAGMLGALLVVFVLLRTLRWRRTTDKAAPTGYDTEPLACFNALSATLSDRGIPRARGESLGLYAARVRADLRPRAVAEQASALLLRYGALRYGHEGEQRDLEQDITRFVSAVDQSEVQPAPTG